MPALAYRQDQSLSPAHLWFTDHLPKLTSRAHAMFHRMRYEERQEAVAEVLASAFGYTLRAYTRGVLDKLTAYSRIVFFGRNYSSGRRFAGASSVCVLAKATQIARGTKVVSVEECRQEFSPEHHHLIAYRLADVLLARRNQDQPFQNVRQNTDYSDILDREQISQKARRVFAFLAETNSDGCQMDLCQELKVTPERVSPLKSELADALARHDYTLGRPLACDLAARKRRGRPLGWSRNRDIPLNAHPPEPVPA